MTKNLAGDVIKMDKHKKPKFIHHIIFTNKVTIFGNGLMNLT